MAKFSATQHRALMSIFNKRLIDAAKRLNEASTQERNQRAPALNADIEKVRLQYEKKAKTLLATKKADEVVKISLVGPSSPKRYQEATSPRFEINRKLDSDFDDLLHNFDFELGKVFEKHGGKVEQLEIKATVEGCSRHEYFELLPKDAAEVNRWLAKRDAFEMELVVGGTDIDLESMLQNLGI